MWKASHQKDTEVPTTEEKNAEANSFMIPVLLLLFYNAGVTTAKGRTIRIPYEDYAVVVIIVVVAATDVYRRRRR